MQSRSWSTEKNHQRNKKIRSKIEIKHHIITGRYIEFRTE
jgi:hypothetical protein